MPVAEAETLVQHSGAELLAEKHDPAADREALEELAASCQQFSPLVGLEDTPEPTCLLLDIAGVAPLFGGEDRLLAKVTEKLHRRGYRVQLGVGETIGQAWAMAQCPVQSTECGENLPLPVGEGRGEGDVGDPSMNPKTPPSPPLPRGGTEFDSAILLPAALRLPGETLDLLDELGITSVAQLQALPRAALASRFGDLLVKRLNQFEGKTKEVIIAHRAAEPFAASWSLEHPTAKREVIEQVLSALLDRLCVQLDEQDRGAVQVECEIKLVDRQQQRAATTEKLTIGLYQPTASATHLSQLMQLQLEGRRWGGLISDVRLHATTTAPLEVTQSELFPDQQRERSRKLALLVDRLSSRLGREQVLSPRPQSDALPERAVEYVPTVDRRSAAIRRTKRSKPSPAAGLTRPLKLYDPPIAVAALAVAPDGPPQRFQFHRWRHTIVRQWGPERIETSWWRGRTVRRDYWRVETETGQRFWLFRRLDDGEWFLHGDFV